MAAAAPPGFDPAAILAKLEGLIKDNQKPPATTGGSSGGSKSWLSTLIIIAVVLMGVAVWSWISWRKNRELAALRHEKEAARITAEQAELLAKVAAGDQVVADRQKQVDKAKEDLRIIEADIRAAEASYEADRRAIDRIRSWDDVPSPR